MIDFKKSKTLVETFEPGKGENAEYDNWGGVMIERLEIAILSITKAKVMEDTSYLKDSAIMTMFDALDWYKSVFKELRDNKAELIRNHYPKPDLKAELKNYHSPKAIRKEKRDKILERLRDGEEFKVKGKNAGQVWRIGYKKGEADFDLFLNETKVGRWKPNKFEEGQNFILVNIATLGQYESSELLWLQDVDFVKDSEKRDLKRHKKGRVKTDS